ncbi:sigma 54-interacting transcriptional regulator [Neptuniibacter sp. QD48_11]|uniref:sigma-54 dependent transcriptional regulator n=1 Tax=unclassified Neptuniibacter TaxID=2630693 RepID=UPI0039F46A1A
MEKQLESESYVASAVNPAIVSQQNDSHEGSHIIYFRPRTEENHDLPDLENVRVLNNHVLAATDSQSAKQLMASKRFQLGIAACHFLDDKVLQELKDILSYDENILWILLLPKPFIDNPQIASLISHYCFDYHTYPVEIERLGIILGHALGMTKLRNKTLTSAFKKDNKCLIGESPVFKEILLKCSKAARVEAPALLIGESGTGKELFAKYIHEYSDRSDKPFIAVNCAALPATLIQSELFGHEKGAFTGADSRRIGRFEEAHDSTIFLDEIGDLPLDMQVILLRFLETKTIERLGSTKTIHANARVIAATHVNLEEAVKEGRFREDLYYRLNVLPLDVPNLQSRGSEDIQRIANYYLERYTKENDLKKKKFSSAALKLMGQNHWSGNIRELINRVCNAAIMSDSMIITAKDMGLDRREDERRLMPLEEAKSRAEKAAILNALRHANNNVTVAASILETSRSSLYRLLEKHQILNN